MCMRVRVRVRVCACKYVVYTCVHVNMWVLYCVCLWTCAREQFHNEENPTGTAWERNSVKNQARV